MNETSSPSNPLFRNTKLKLNRPSPIKNSEEKLSSEREDQQEKHVNHQRKISEESNEIIFKKGKSRGIVKNLKISNEAGIIGVKDLTKGQKKVNERINTLAERSRSNSKELTTSFVRPRNDFSPSIEEGQARLSKRNLHQKLLDTSIKEIRKEENSPLNEDLDETGQQKRKSHSVQKLPSKKFDEILPKEKSIMRSNSKTLIRKDSQNSQKSIEKVKKTENSDESIIIDKKKQREEKAKKAWKKSKIASYAWTWKGANGFLDP
ncbi:unnamed protein product [Blepharisma stoltei]|uniref:Uncharacterized protein n=1 Tax=Blepharisma stoltei TaxID=1481888 RepID=A0AAU9IVZ2_9CILI|nr:unnamed protein product [Blepharisma stoltei]